MSVANKYELKEYVLRALGAPLVDIDVTDEAFDDRIDEAIALFREYYFDGSDRYYYRHIITATDLANQYITMPEYIWGVNGLFPVSNSATSPSIFDLQYQFRQWDMASLTSTSLVYYTQVMQHLSLLDITLNITKQIRFNRNEGRLYIDTNWDAKMPVDTWILVDCYSVIDPDGSPKFWNNRVFKEYVTALVKKQWSAAYKKFDKIQLPGGVVIDGKDLYQEAVAECKEIEQDIINNSSPLQFFTG
jgi:hypothetical protein